MSNPLLPLGVAEPDPFPLTEAPTPKDANHIVHRGVRVLRRWSALPDADQRLVEHILDCIERRNVQHAKL